MRRAFASAAIVTAIALIYFRSTAAYFFNDDFHWLEQTQSFDPINVLDLSRYDHFYRPVIEAYFFGGLSLFGCEAFPFHLASIGVHAVTTLLVYLLAREVAGSSELSDVYGLLSALFFAVQPGFTDAITWIGAITDLLPVPFYVLTLWLHLRFLRRPGWLWYVSTLATFIACLLTHESAATLLPMMLLLDCTIATSGPVGDRCRALARQWVRFAPFVVLLLAYLGLAYVVNSRSYLVREGHYMVGWHAIPNVLNYIISLYVGRRAVVDYTATIALLAAIIVLGNSRMRFSVLWIVVTLLPVSFFTWGNATRYLYLPAVGFSMLLADLMLGLHALAERRTAASTARVVTTVVVAVLVMRFGIFAKKAADSFPARTARYERFVEELRRSNPGATAGSTVFIDSRFLEGVPEIYREPAARVGLCVPNVVLQVR